MPADRASGPATRRAARAPPQNRSAPAAAAADDSKAPPADAALAGLKPFAAAGGTLVQYAPSPADAQAEARAHEAHQVFLGRGGVALRPGDAVIDAGANVGAFARAAAPLAGPNGAVYCIEPLPEVARALRVNAKLYAEWAAARGVEPARIVVVEAGVGAPGGPATRDFTYYPRITAFSTMYRDDADAAAATYSLVVHRPESFSAVENVGKALARCMPALYRALHTAAFTALLLRPALRVACRMTTVSDVIDAHGIGDVGLLKANVERAEWDVLLGVRAAHWPRIRQVALQVHDIDGRVAAVAALLRSKGFARVTVWREPRFAACDLHMVYAVR